MTLIINDNALLGKDKIHVIEASYAKELEAKLAVAVKALESLEKYIAYNGDDWVRIEASLALEQIKQMKAGLW